MRQECLECAFLGFFNVAFDFLRLIESLLSLDTQQMRYRWNFHKIIFLIKSSLHKSYLSVKNYASRKLVHYKNVQMFGLSLIKFTCMETLPNMESRNSCVIRNIVTTNLKFLLALLFREGCMLL